MKHVTETNMNRRKKIQGAAPFLLSDGQREAKRGKIKLSKKFSAFLGSFLAVAGRFRSFSRFSLGEKAFYRKLQLPVWAECGFLRVPVARQFEIHG
jgi:hypothetical protein